MKKEKTNHLDEIKPLMLDMEENLSEKEEKGLIYFPLIYLYIPVSLYLLLQYIMYVLSPKIQNYRETFFFRCHKLFYFLHILIQSFLPGPACKMGGGEGVSGKVS